MIYVVTPDVGPIKCLAMRIIPSRPDATSCAIQAETGNFWNNLFQIYEVHTMTFTFMTPCGFIIHGKVIGLLQHKENRLAKKEQKRT